MESLSNWKTNFWVISNNANPTPFVVDFKFELEVLISNKQVSFFAATGVCLTCLLVVPAVAVIVIVIIMRAHKDSVFKKHLPPRWLTTTMHYLKYPLCLWHVEFQLANCQFKSAASNSAARSTIRRLKNLVWFNSTGSPRHGTVRLIFQRGF